MAKSKAKAALAPVTIRALKGFDANLRCRDFQFEVGKTYTHDGRVSPCNSGFHACTRPQDVWSYYGPCAARFAVVELSGEIVPGTDGDSKHAASVIKIIEEVPLAQFIKLLIEDVASDAKATIAEGNSSTAASSGNYSKAASSGDYSTAASSGNYSKAASSGNSSTAASSGDYSKAASSGDYSKACAEGIDTIAMAAGCDCHAKAGENGCIALCWNDGKRNRIAVGYIGENGIEADVLYRVDEDGKFVKA